MPHAGQCSRDAYILPSVIRFNFWLALTLVRQLDQMVFVGPFQLNYSALILKFNSDFIFKPQREGT